MATLENVGPVFISILVVYFLIVLGIGYYGYTKTKDEADFLVAGREIGPIVGGATLAATQMSAGTFVGTVGFHYFTGISYIWIWAPLWMGWIISLLFVAPHMRRFGEVTLPDFMATRYGDDRANGDYVRSISAVLIVIGYLVYITAEYIAGGLIFTAMFGVDNTTGIIILMVAVMVYTAIGGMRASMLTDFLQAVVMATGAIIAIPLTLNLIGGIGQINAIFNSFNPSFVGMALTPLQLLGFGTAFGLYIAVSPNQIQRIYSLRDEKTVRQAIGLTFVFQAIIAIGVGMIGVSMAVLYPQLATPDVASIILGLDVLGPVLGALVIAAVLSAILSSVDSIMITSSSALSHDFYAMIINPDASERRKVWAGRVGVFIMGIIPFFLAAVGELLGGLVQLIIVLQVSMHAGMFFIPIIAGLHWRRANTPAGIASMIIGFLGVAVWHVSVEILDVIPTPFSEVMPILVGITLSAIAMFTIPYFTGKPSRQSLERFFDVSSDEPENSTGVAEDD